MSEALAVARSRYTLLRRALPTPEARVVLFGLSLGDDATDEVIASIRRHLPMELIAGVRINAEEYDPLG